MRFTALATDYDGTLAHEGVVSPAAVEALRRLRSSGRRAILVTGRTMEGLEGLVTVFPETREFDYIVAENGSILYDPSTNTEKALAGPPAEAFRKIS